MSEETDELLSRISFLVPLNKLPPERQSRLLEQSEVVKLKKKQTLFKQGERDDFTYYLLEGNIEMYADDSLIKAVSGGDGASFQPLAQLQPRQMSAVAKTAIEVLQVKRSLLDQLLSMDDTGPEADGGTGMEVEEMESAQGGDWLMTLLQSELFTRIPPSNIQGLLDTLETVEFAVGDEVIKQGEPGDYYFAIQSGACEVVRSGSNKREIKLATLNTGDTFGEEALISGGKRNATVRMTTAGELARLTKDDFTRLIKAPLLNSMSLETAEGQVAAGAHWLDVRFEDEHVHNGIAGSLNIPHSMLRTRMDELDAEATYITYCDTGGRSSAAAFLLAEKGFDVGFVEGGAVTEPIPQKPAAAPAAEAAPKAEAKKPPAAKTKPKPAAAAPSAAAPAAQAKPTESAQTDAIVEANALASSLNAEREKAQLIIDKAEKMMAEAEAMKLEAERVVAEKLAKERERIDLETAKLKEKLAEAQRLKESLGEQQKQAEIEAARREGDVEDRVKTLEAEAEARLAEEEQRLEALYQKQTEQLESLQAEREEELRVQLDQELASERDRLSKEKQQSTKALEETIAERRQAFEQREAELRKQLSDELTSERAKFTEQVMRTNEELETAREERRQALAAKEAAAIEAQESIAAFKAEQQALQEEQQAAIEAERQRLKEEATRLEQLRDEVVRQREAAAVAKSQAEEALAEAKSRRVEQAASPADDLEIIEIEERASVAELELQKALKAESVVVEAAKDNEDELERTYDTATEINMLLEKELNEFVGEQDELLNSTLQREVLSRQKEMVERIKARAAEKAAQSVDRDQGLLDEIAAQLRKD